MARRSLKNLSLAYIMETESDEAQQLCLSQLKRSTNMTDTLAALTMLAQYDWPQRGQQLELFYSRWQHDAQVIDKWFGIQAGSRLPDTLSRVEELMAHPAFRLTNPNKVRALIGRFCLGNPYNFHAADGSGYNFLTDRILELDKINPQIAARLVSGMSRWRRFEETRSRLMQQALKRILSEPGLSRDVYEIASKSLD
jgi:aminopeptidase N